MESPVQTVPPSVGHSGRRSEERSEGVGHAEDLAERGGIPVQHQHDEEGEEQRQQVSKLAQPPRHNTAVRTREVRHGDLSGSEELSVQGEATVGRFSIANDRDL